MIADVKNVQISLKKKNMTLWIMIVMVKVDQNQKEFKVKNAYFWNKWQNDVFVDVNMFGYCV